MMSITYDIILMQYWIAVLEKNLYRSDLFSVRTEYWFTIQNLSELKHCGSEISPLSGYSIRIQYQYTVHGAYEQYLSVRFNSKRESIFTY